MAAFKKHFQLKIINDPPKNGRNDRETSTSRENSVKRNKNKNKNARSVLPNQHSRLLHGNNETNLRQSTSENPIIYRNQCPCDMHYNKQLLHSNFAISVNKLFDLIFGSNEFVNQFRLGQRFFDVSCSEWLPNESTNHRERTLKYKLPFEATFFGRGTIFTREKQTIYHEVSDSHYVLETEVYNEGMPYCDTFSLIIRYCLVQTSITTTNLRVTACILFNRTVNRFLKQVIERNAYSASINGLKDLNSRLNRIENHRIEKRRLSDDILLVNSPTPDSTRRKSQNNEIPILINDNKSIQTPNLERILYFLIVLIAILILLHIHLHMRLQNMDSILERLAYLLKI